MSLARRKRTPSSATLTRAVLVAAPLALLPVPLTAIDSVVALGDSLFAGFSSGGLVETVQRESIPARFADALTQGGTLLPPFEQPLVGEPGLPALLELVGTMPLAIAPKPGVGEALNGDLARPFDNLAVPGFDLGDALRTTSGNPLVEVVLRDRGTMLQQALDRHASLALVWLGNNDALAALTSGVVIDDITLTTVETFRSDLRQLVSSLTGSGAEVVLLEIPQSDDVPFATYLPPVVIDPESGSPILDQGETVSLIGPDGRLGCDDRVLLPALTAIRTGQGVPVAQGGSGTPLSNALVLSAAERATIRARIDDYNRQIRIAARDFGATVSARPARAFEAAASRWREDGCPLGSPDQPFGRFFSLDAIHPTAYGYGILANALLEDLAPLTGAAPPLAPEELCLGDGFVATARWMTGDGRTGTAHPVPVSPTSGHFWFFTADNVELTAKVLDACALDGHHWLFAGGLTSVGVDLEVTDTRDGTSVTYSSTPGSPFEPVLDTTTLAGCP